ncbi:MAG: hypothetical protein OK439_06505 [Thaumarchaeota archaeon]|nr:hypothetical protein [Nitrososphaerota archaeon]
MNLKKLQSNARRKLGLTGEFEYIQVSGGTKGRILATSQTKSTLEMKHTITYSDASSLDPADVYHEMCRARLYELGFKSIEAAALVALKDCSKDDPKYIFDANSAVVIVSEVYTSWLLYTYFPQESEERRQEIVLRFELSDALTSLHTRMGFWGTGGIVYYRIASEWAGKSFPSAQIKSAIDRASDGASISEEITKIEAVLSLLPRIEKIDEQLTDSIQIQILSVIVELFSSKTGINCE